MPYYPPGSRFPGSKRGSTASPGREIFEVPLPPRPNAKTHFFRTVLTPVPSLNTRMLTVYGLTERRAPVDYQMIKVSEPDWALLEKGVRYLLAGPLERAVMDHEGELP